MFYAVKRFLGKTGFLIAKSEPLLSESEPEPEAEDDSEAAAPDKMLLISAASSVDVWSGCIQS